MESKRGLQEFLYKLFVENNAMDLLPLFLLTEMVWQTVQSGNRWSKCGFIPRFLCDLDGVPALVRKCKDLVDGACTRSTPKIPVR